MVLQIQVMLGGGVTYSLVIEAIANGCPNLEVLKNRFGRFTENSIPALAKLEKLHHFQLWTNDVDSQTVKAILKVIIRNALPKNTSNVPTWLHLITTQFAVEIKLLITTVSNLDSILKKCYT